MRAYLVEQTTQALHIGTGGDRRNVQHGVHMLVNDLLFVPKALLQSSYRLLVVGSCQGQSSDGFLCRAFHNRVEVIKLLNRRQVGISVYCSFEGLPERGPLR